MKKLLILICILLSNRIVQTDELDLSVLTKKNVQIGDQNSQKFNYYIDEYEDRDLAIDEYEEHVCDHVQPQVLSPLQAYMADFFGSFYVHMVGMQEFAHTYFIEFKQTVSKLLATLVKK